MGGADWNAYNLPAIWSMLEHENACSGADRVLSWDSLAQDVRAQHRRLLKAGEDLAAVWSPAANASAAVFLRRMDQLAASMNQTLTRAEDTRAGLRGIMEAISEAQAAIQPYVEVRKEVSDDLIPRWADHAEDEYDDKARQAMRSAEAAIADHKTQIQPPTLYDPRNPVEGPGGDIPGGDGTTSGAGSGTRGAGGSGTPGGSDAGSVRATPVPVPVPHDPPASDRNPELISGGTGSGAPGTSGHGGGGAELAGVLPLPSAVQPSPGVVATPPGLPGSMVPGGGVPGAVIGGGVLGLTPGVGAGGAVGGMGAPMLPFGGKPAAPGRQAVSMRTAMPSGTVIGANKAGAGGRSVTAQPLPNQAAPQNRSRRGAADDDSIEGKADQTWDVDQGVAPVIEPDRRKPRHDPGPGVIGLSR